MFSIGYGADKDGKVAMNFGPLNRDGGWRRLNVAVSRARYEMKAFSMLTSLLAVICDGYNYSSSRCARDREIIQMDVLHNLGWDVYRLWIMDWWAMKDATLKKLTSAIDKKVLSIKEII